MPPKILYLSLLLILLLPLLFTPTTPASITTNTSPTITQLRATLVSLLQQLLTLLTQKLNVLLAQRHSGGSGGGGGGGGGGGSSGGGGSTTCTESWTCSDWSLCTNSNQTRTCTDSHSCGTTTTKPAETQTCTVDPLPDTTPPSVSLTSPQNNATVSGTITISATATDQSGIASAQFQLDSTTLATDTTAPYSTLYDTTQTTNTTHTIQAIAQDNAGNYATSTVTVVVENEVSSNCTYTINPGESINKYSSTAQPGDTVCIRAGTYTETLTPQNSGTAGHLITFKAYPGEGCINQGGNKVCQVIITGQVKIESGYDDPSLIPNGLDYIRIEGFEIVSSSQKQGILIQNGYWNPGTVADGLEIVNNYIHSLDGCTSNCNSAGINAAYVTDLIIEDNKVDNTEGSGIEIVGFCSNDDCSIKNFRNNNIVIRGNTITNVPCDGIRPKGNNILIENNNLGYTSVDFFTDCHQDGFEMYGPNENVTIKNNLIWDWTQNIYISGEDGFDMSNINILGNTVWCSLRCDQTGAHSSSAGLNIGPNSGGIYNLSVLGNSFENVSINVTNSYADTPAQWINNLTVLNNIFHGGGDCTTHGCGQYDSCNSNGCPVNFQVQSTALTEDYNIYYRRTNFEGTIGTHSANVNPLFVDDANYNLHLQLGSPAINQGTTISELSPDIDSTTRPQGSGYDIGAYEYQGGTSQAPLSRPNFLASVYQALDQLWSRALGF